MVRTPACDLPDIEDPIALGGMGSVFSPDLVAAVSNAGGLGDIMPAGDIIAGIAREAEAILTERRPHLVRHQDECHSWNSF